MAQQVQKVVVKAPSREETTTREPENLENVALAEDVEDLLAEIDDVLEENAEEFVRSYIQKGGE